MTFYGIGRDSAFTVPTGWAQLYSAQQGGAAANRSSVASHMKLMPTAGATGAATSTVSTGQWVAHQASFRVDNVNPTATVGDPGNPLVGTVNLAATADDVDSHVASVQVQRSPAGAGTWTDIGAADVTAPYSISFDTTSVANGLYDLRAVATDLAGNTGASPVVEDVQVANPSGSVGSSATVSNANNGATTVVIPVPAGTQNKDLLVAHLSTRGGTGTTVTPAEAGWTALQNATSGTTVRLATYYRVATGSELAPYTFTLSNSQRAVGAMTALSGIKTTDPIDVNGGTATATSATATANSVTTTVAGSIAMAFFTVGRGTTFTQPGGWAERYDFQHVNLTATNKAALAGDTRTMALAGATLNAASTITSGAWVAHQAAFEIDKVGPSVTMTSPSTPIAGVVAVSANATDADTRIVGVRFQRSLAGVGPWTNVGAVDTTAPYSVSFDTTSVADGLYDFRAIGEDGAGNVTYSALLTNRRIDNTAPGSTTSFPVAATTNSAATWNAGCATSGLCGTQSDGGSGVQGVGVSIQQGSGNYWNGTDFSSATEVWNAATLAGGNWSLAFPAGSFPADGSYTVRARATDIAGNAEAPSTRTFTVDLTAPQTTIDSNPANPTSSTSADFTFSSSEGGSTYECRIDGGAWGACTSPHNYTTLADGSHTFDVRATDAVGNTDATPASYTWLVDTTAPSSTAVFPTASGSYTAAEWNAGCATSGLCGTYGDGSGSGVAEVEISIRQGSGDYWNGTAFASATEVWNDATLAAGNWSLAFPAASLPADGSYTVRVRARDAVANTETPSIRTFDFDATAPSSTTTFPADATDYNGAGWAAGCAPDGLCGTYTDVDLRGRRGRGLHPAGRRQLLERLGVRQRHRGLERRFALGRRLVARVRLG